METEPQSTVQTVMPSVQPARIALVEPCPKLSIVVPCFNEEEVLPETAKRLRALLDRLTQLGKITADSQVILVDDGSRDRTWELVRQYHKDDPRVRGVKLSANRGHQTALVAGLYAAEGTQ